MAETLRTLAPAKVNLWLHVAAPDHSGYHPLRSLVAFADIGDEVRFTPDTSGTFSLSINGPFAEGLSSEVDNLILKAAAAFSRAIDIPCGGAFHLKKTLPVASGLGGGSSDAGAALRLLREAFSSEMSDTALESIAASLGADGAMCLWGRSCIAEGYGEKLTPVAIPRLPAVLINPGIACATGEVYSTFDKALPDSELGGEVSLPQDADEIRHLISANRNDLEPAAKALKPEIADLLSKLQAQPETMLARMSGSGATCFVLCRTMSDAEILSDRLKNISTNAWVTPCILD